MTLQHTPLFEAVFADGQCPGGVPADVLAHVLAASGARAGSDVPGQPQA